MNVWASVYLFWFFLSQFMSSLRGWQRNSPSQIRVRLPTVRSLSVYALQSNYEPHPKFPNDLQRCVRGTSIVFFFCQSIHRTNSQLHLCVQTRASAAQNSWWMGARRTSVRLWLCQIITCLHGDKTWNSAAWFACVSSRMHNASRAWIIYINKWRESVWCSAKPFLFYFHLKGFFCVCVCVRVWKKKGKPKQTSILERQMADGVKLSLLSKITLWWKWRLPWKSGSGAICWTLLRGHGGHLANSQKNHPHL